MGTRTRTGVTAAAVLLAFGAGFATAEVRDRDAVVGPGGDPTPEDAQLYAELEVPEPPDVPGSPAPSPSAT